VSLRNLDVIPAGLAAAEMAIGRRVGFFVGFPKRHISVFFSLGFTS
jgi:hypothetical protein